MYSFYDSQKFPSNVLCSFTLNVIHTPKYINMLFTLRLFGYDAMKIDGGYRSFGGACYFHPHDIPRTIRCLLFSCHVPCYVMHTSFYPQSILPSNLSSFHWPFTPSPNDIHSPPCVSTHPDIIRSSIRKPTPNVLVRDKANHL